MTEHLASSRDERMDRQTALASDIARHGVALCKSAIARLGGEGPRWTALVGHIDELRKTLTTGDMIAAHWDLTLVSDDVRSIGVGLAAEAKSLKALIAENILLSQRIEQVADDVRFLAAIVSHAKVEMASLDDKGEALESFGHALESLAVKAKATLHEYRSKHAVLLDLLRNTATVQSAFETTQKARLMLLAEDLEVSASELSALRLGIETTAIEIDVASQIIRDEIEQGLILARAADAASRRVGDVGATLADASDGDLDRSAADFGEEPDFRERDPIASERRVERQDRLGEARAELRTAVNTFLTHLDRISTATQQLAVKNQAPSRSRGDPTNSFLDKLGPKLQEARILIDECRKSRIVVESMAEKVIPTFEALNGLADSVTIMVTDITISGTNAIVKSHRLGQGAAGLSIIAQHLRSHALRVAEGIIALAPLLTSARVANREFMKSTEDHDAAHLAEIATRMTAVVDSFTVVDTFTMKVMTLVREEAASLGAKIPGIVEDLRKITAMDDRLQIIADGIAPMTDAYIAGARHANNERHHDAATL